MTHSEMLYKLNCNTTRKNSNRNDRMRGSGVNDSTYVRMYT